MGYNTNDLRCAVTLCYKTGVNKQVLSASNKSIETIIINDININGPWIKASSFKHWLRVNSDGIFNFGISDKSSISCVCILRYGN